MGSDENSNTKTKYIEKFKVSITSIKDKKNPDKHRYVFSDVENGGIADKMRIIDQDEIMIVNGTSWVQDETFHSVYELFENAPVDGKTRFSVVLERSKHKSRDPPENKSVKTIDTSAILVYKGGVTTAKKKDVKTIPKINDYEGTNYRYFRVTGTPGYYLKVKNGNVYAGPLDADDKSSVITFTTSSTGRIIIKYLSTLQGQENSYIAINSENKVVAQIDEAEFLYERRGSGLISFQKYIKGDDAAEGDIAQTQVNRQETSHKPVYLAGNLKSVEDIVTLDKAFYFEEFPLDDAYTEQKNSIDVQQRTNSQQRCNIL